MQVLQMSLRPQRNQLKCFYLSIYLSRYYYYTRSNFYRNNPCNDTRISMVQAGSKYKSTLRKKMFMIEMKHNVLKQHDCQMQRNTGIC